MPEITLADITAKQEEVKELIGSIQSDFTAKGEKTDETIIKMEGSIAEMIEDCQKLTLALETETKSREQLEQVVSRLGSRSNDGGEEKLSDEDYTKSFDNAIRKRTRAIDVDAHTKEVNNIVNYYAKNATADEIDFMVKTLSVGVNADGGYFVPLDPLRKITERVFETSPMRSVSSVITTANEAITVGLDDEEADSGWVCEYETRSDTDTPGLGEIELTTHEQYAYPKATLKMLEDAAFDVEGWLTRKLGSRFGRVENASFVNGDGNKKPRGWNTLGEWANNEIYERNKLASLITNTASTFDGDDLIDLQALLLEDYQPMARWAMHRKIWAQTIKLKASDGHYLINPMLIFQGTQPQLLGAPVTLMGDMPATVADGGFPVAYGDFEEGYTIVDRIGIRIIRDEITRPGFVKWHARKRLAGDVTNYQAIKRLKIKAA